VIACQVPETSRLAAEWHSGSGGLRRCCLRSCSSLTALNGADEGKGMIQ
jgi:hypothetical protein